MATPGAETAKSSSPSPSKSSITVSVPKYPIPSLPVIFTSPWNLDVDPETFTSDPINEPLATISPVCLNKNDSYVVLPFEVLRCVSYL